MHSTMEDIARECGISKMTVSRVLRGREGVSDATRDKVLQTSKRLHYEFNALAQNFARRQSGFVGVATPFEGLVGSNYFADIIKGFQIVMGDTAWDFALFDTLSTPFSDGSKLERLYRTRRVDGLLVVAPHAHDGFLETLRTLRMPMVVIGELVAARKVCCVTCDDQKGMELVCAHLYSLGHRRIAFVGGPPNLMSAGRRERAYLDFCRRRKFSSSHYAVQVGDYTMKSGRLAGLTLLRQHTRPTAIVAANDAMAFGVMESARELGLNIPADISITGFDDLPTAAQLFPPLTTVHQPVAEMAEHGARLLLAALHTGNNPERQVSLPVSLVARDSTAAPTSRKS